MPRILNQRISYLTIADLTAARATLVLVDPDDAELSKGGGTIEFTVSPVLRALLEQAVIEAQAEVAAVKQAAVEAEAARRAQVEADKVARTEAALAALAAEEAAAPAALLAEVEARGGVLAAGDAARLRAELGIDP